MKPRNDEVAEKLVELGELFEAKGVDYKPRAYTRAATNIRDHDMPVQRMSLDRLTTIEGVGEQIAEDVIEYIETGSITKLEELREEIPGAGIPDPEERIAAAQEEIAQALNRIADALENE